MSAVGTETLCCGCGCLLPAGVQHSLPVPALGAARVVTVIPSSWETITQRPFLPLLKRLAFMSMLSDVDGTPGSALVSSRPHIESPSLADGI